jgi:hypothetical protein
VLYSIDELMPGDALVLDVLFSNNSVPRGGISFIDENGQERHMVIGESMRGGCFPYYHLTYFQDRTTGFFRSNFDDIRLTPDNNTHDLLTVLLGEYELGEVQRAGFGDFWDEGEEQLYRFLHHNRPPLFALIQDSRPSLYHPQTYRVGVRISDHPSAALAATMLEADIHSIHSLTWLDLGTEVGDVILVHSEKFLYTWILVDIGDDGWYNKFYMIMPLTTA